MADNVAITAGSGTSISAAEITTLNGGTVAAVEMQRVKVAYGTGATAREVDTTFPLPTTVGSTDYARLPAVSTSYLASSAATNNLTQIKATAGAIKTIHGYNARTSAIRIKLFGLPSASVTAGTTAAVKSIYIPATSGFVFDFPTGYSPSGGTGLSFMLTTGGGLTDNTAVAAGDILDFNVDYL